MTDIKRLINKYYRKDGEDLTGISVYNNGERYSNEYKRKIRQDSARKHRHLILDELITEVPFHLTKTQTTQIRYWIDSFNEDFKNFHRRSSNETIILALIFIQRKQFDNKTRVEEFSICSKYNLTEPVFLTIQNRLIFNLMNSTQLKYSQAKYVNNEISTNKEK